MIQRFDRYSQERRKRRGGGEVNLNLVTNGDADDQKNEESSKLAVRHSPAFDGRKSVDRFDMILCIGNKTENVHV